MRLALFVASILLFAACATPDEPQQPTEGTLAVTDAWARPGLGTDTTRVTTAAYLTLSNGTGAAVTLTRAESDVAERVELHESTMEDGMMRMRPVEGVEVPRGGSVELRPGGPHVMLIGLTRDLAENDTFPLRLHFAHGETINVDVTVRPATL